MALLDDGMLNVIPDNPREAYDMHDLIRYIVDDGYFFEMMRLRRPPSASSQ